MFAPLATRFLQHLIAQNAWAKPHLQAFAGNTVQFKSAFFSANLDILEDGSLSISAKTSTPQAIIHAPPSLILRLLAGDDSAQNEIHIEGDTHLAAEIAKILRHVRWDIEEDLSKVVGDIAANKSVSAAKSALQEAKKQTTNAAEMLAEFWQEEKPILAKKRHVEQFNADVDALVGDVARLEKRLAKLANKIRAR